MTEIEEHFEEFEKKTQILKRQDRISIGYELLKKRVLNTIEEQHRRDLYGR